MTHDKFPEPDAELDRLAATVVDAALEVHRTLGPGFLEAVYEHALCLELAAREVPVRRQVPVSVEYKGTVVGTAHLDLLIAERLVVELKAVEVLATVHAVQLRSYLKATGCSLGLLVNFNAVLLRDGLRRVIQTSRLQNNG